MPPRKNHAGKRVERLTLIRHVPVPGRKTMWLARCQCGNEITVWITNVLRKHTRSCGCLAQETRRKTTTKHGYYKTPTYSSWASMVYRCKHGFGKYAQVSVCKRWSNTKTGFVNFLADMGERPEGHTLDRRHNSRGYYPSNCRWATVKQQNYNRTNSVMLKHGGRRMCLAEWSNEVGIKPATLRARKQRGWSDAEALGFK